MGAWGGFAIFDYDKFVSEIIPALKTGADHPLVKIEIDKINYHDRNLHRSPKFKGLESVIETFDDKLSTTAIGKKFVFFDGTIIKEPQNFNYKNLTYWDY